MTHPRSPRRRLVAAMLGAGLGLLPLLGAACDEDGDAQFACAGEGFCLEYYGPGDNVARIRAATDCEGAGGTELDACPDGGSACTLPRNEGSGVGSTQSYYDLDEESVEATAQICASAGGTFDP